MSFMRATCLTNTFYTFKNTNTRNVWIGCRRNFPRAYCGEKRLERINAHLKPTELAEYLLKRENFYLK